MKFGFRMPSPMGSLKARTTGAAKRAIKKALIPGYGRKGMGLLRDPKRSAYNFFYHRTTFGVSDLMKQGAKQPASGGCCVLLVFSCFSVLGAYCFL